MPRTVELIDTIGGKEIYAAHSNSADKDGANNVISSTYLKKNDQSNTWKDTGIKVAYDAGSGITIVQNTTDTNLKAVIATDLVETPVVAGTGISITDNTSEVEFATLPDTITYVTASPVMGASSALPLNMASGQYSTFASLGQDTSLGLDNDTGITGLDTSKLYRCTARVQAVNSGSSILLASISAPSWISGTSSTVSAAVPAGTTIVMQMVWYSKGNATMVPEANTAAGLTTGIVELTAEEVCDV